MKTILIRKNHASGSTAPAHPMATPGIARLKPELITIAAIRNVPANFPLEKLLRLWSRTCDCTWLKNWDEKAGSYVGRCSFEFSELGEGAIILK